MTESQELIYDLVYLVVNFGVTILSFVLCYILAKKNHMSGWFTFLGFFGLIGIVAVVLVAKFGNTNYDDYNRMNNNQSSYNNSGYYNGQNGNNTNNYDSQNGAGNSGYYGVQNGNTYGSSDTFVQNGEVIIRKYKSCPKCGAKLDEKASFCTYCGKQL